MTDRDPLASLKNAWGTEDRSGSLPLASQQDLERRARQLAQQVLRRNALEWIAAGVVVLIFGAWAVTTDRWMIRVGSAWTAAAALWIAWVLVRRGGNLPHPAWDAPTSVYLRYQRSQLERQATLLERVPTWYALPLAVGTGLLLSDQVRQVIERGSPVLGMVAVGIVIVMSLGVYLAVLVANRRAARELRRQLMRLPNEE